MSVSEKQFEKASNELAEKQSTYVPQIYAFIKDTSDDPFLTAFVFCMSWLEGGLLANAEKMTREYPEMEKAIDEYLEICQVFKKLSALFDECIASKAMQKCLNLSEKDRQRMVKVAKKKYSTNKQEKAND